MITNIFQDSVEITDATGDRINVGPGFADVPEAREWVSIVSVHPRRIDGQTQYIALTREDAVALAAALANLVAQADARAGAA